MSTNTENKSYFKDSDIFNEMVKWHNEHFEGKRDWDKTSGEYLTRNTQLAIAKHFAQWAINQITKDAIEADAFIDYERNFGLGNICADVNIRNYGLEDGGKVKIVIIKES